MTLYKFLSSLLTTDIKAFIKTEEKEICTIFTYGVDALDEVYKDSEVVSWELTNAKTLIVLIQENVPSG